MIHDIISKYPSGIEDDVFKMNLKAYKTPPTTYDCLMRNHLQQEISTARDYEGRELLELIQNADDAGADIVGITLRGEKLTITNNGDKPFTVDGYASIMRSDQSTKLNPKYIGCKGLGFRSVINWASTIVVRSLLCPGSKDGIECRFSQEIAIEYYDQLKESWGTLSENTKVFLSQIIETSGRPVPLSILAIPKVEKWVPSDSQTTQIELDLLPDAINDVNMALENLASSSFYLFLHNLKYLTIDINGAVTTILCDKSKVGYATIEITKDDKNTYQQWVVESYENTKERISVAAARRIDAEEENHHTSYLHSFFPTLITPGYGCVLHASIELDKSRNHMLTTPSKVFDSLAKTVIRLAERIKALRSKNPTWEAYDILFSNSSTERLGKQWEQFISIIDNARRNMEFCPSASGSYLSLNDSVRISEGFSSWVINRNIHFPAFNKVIKHGYSPYQIEPTSIENFQGELTAFSSQDIDLDLRAEFIKTIAGAVHDNNNYYKSNDINISLLTDSEGTIIRETAHIFSGRKNKIPSILSLKIVDTKLVTILKEHLKEQYEAFAIQNNRDPNESDERKLVAYLKKVTKVTTTDFNDIKDRLTAASKETHTIDDDKEIICYLFNEYKSTTKFEFKTPEPLHLLNATGRPTQICNLLYTETDGEWATLVRDWDESTGGSAEETLQFMVNVLKMSTHVPLKMVPWNFNGYLETMDYHQWQYEVEEIRTSPTYNFGKGYVVDENWLMIHSYSEIINKLLADTHAYISVVKKPYELYYKAQKYIYPVQQTCSPAAHSIRKTKGLLDNYIISTCSWVGEEKFDPDEFDKDMLNPLALALGAKWDENSLNTDEIYNLVLTTPKNSHIDKYQYYKDLLLKKDGVTPPSDLMLWATYRGALLDDKVAASECFYADNPLPLAISDKLKLFDIGRRVGEDNVNALFGVRKATSIITTPIINEARALKDLQEMIRDSIYSRQVMLLAARCQRITNSTMRREQANILNKIDIMVYSEMNFSFQLPHDNIKREETLQRGEFILDSSTQYRYFLVYRNTNFTSDISLVEIVAGILCHAFKLDGSDNHRKFYDILRRDHDELSHIEQQDYSEEYITDIKKLLSGDFTSQNVTKKIPFDSLMPAIKTIINHLIRLYHKECLADESKQLGYFNATGQISSETESKCREWFRSNQDKFHSVEELKKAIFIYMGLSENQSAITETPNIADDSIEWFKSTYTSPFDAQNELGEHYSLLFFPGKLDEIKSIFKSIHHTDIKPLENVDSVVDLQISQGKISKPALPGSTSSGPQNTHRKNQISSNQIIRGRKAEERVRDYLIKKGYTVYLASSNTDPLLVDNAHYDMLYEKDGITHYVEVKNTTDGTIHLSTAEFEFARKKAPNYDLYIVCNDKLSIFENASNLISRNTTPEGYIMHFELETQ